MTTERKTSDERKEALGKLIASRLSQGRRIETQSDYQAVLVQGHRVNHILHLILSLLTLFWVIVWVILVLTGGEKRELVAVDEWGMPTVSRL